MLVCCHTTLPTVKVRRSKVRMSYWRHAVVAPTHNRSPCRGDSNQNHGQEGSRRGGVWLRACHGVEGCNRGHKQVQSHQWWVEVSASESQGTCHTELCSTC